MKIKNIKKIKPKSTKEWLGIKKGTLGGSEITAVLGLNKWLTPYDIWCIKTGKKEFAEPTMVMKRGKHFEHALVSLWEEEEGHRVIKSSATDILYIDKEYPFLSVTPDRRFFHKEGGKRTLEAKTTFGRHDEPLDSWIMQLQWELMFTGDKFGEIVWEFPDPRQCYKSISFESNKDIQKEMKDYAIWWWNEYVIADKEPPLINSNDILAKFPIEEEGKFIEASDSLANKYSYMKQIQDIIKTNTDILDGHKEEMKVFMQDAESVKYYGQTLFTWKANKNGTRVFKIF